MGDRPSVLRELTYEPSFVVRRDCCLYNGRPIISFYERIFSEEGERVWRKIDPSKVFASETSGSYRLEFSGGDNRFVDVIPLPERPGQGGLQEISPEDETDGWLEPPNWRGK